MQKRELWKVILFGLITFGIYDLVWLYKTRNEMVAKGSKIPTFWLLLLPVLLLVGVFVLQFALRFIFAVNDSDGATDSNTLLRLLNVITILVSTISIFGLIPLAIYWIYKYSQAVESVTGGRTTFGFSFGLWFVLTIFSVGFVWPALIQDGFNKYT